VNQRKYDFYTVSASKYSDGFAVYGWGTYPSSSVLAGQPMKVFIASFPTMEAAQKAHPEATPANQWTEPQVSLNHLPGEDDPVPGGMYPDDI
jgi:hypothetical protein